MTLSFTTSGAAFRLALGGIAVLYQPIDFAGLGIQCDQRGIGLVQENFSVAIRRARFTVSQHITGMTFGSCFGSYFHRIFRRC